jgi:magnesium transporter
LVLLEEGRSQELVEFLDDLHPVELAGVVNSAAGDARAQLLQHITGLDEIAGLITYANDPLRRNVIEVLDDARIAAVIRRQEVDDAADVLSMLPRRRQVGILRRLNPRFVKEITSLLSYDNDTAGRIMTTSFLAVPGDGRSDEIICQLRSNLRAENIDPDTNIAYVYVVDDAGRLIGVMSLRELLKAPQDTPLIELMTQAVVSVEPDDDQEHVAKLIVDYDFACIPVIAPEDGKLIGIVTVDDILDVIEEEHTEDLLRLAGTEDSDTIGASVATAFRSRLPWLLASWVGGIGAAMLLNSYEGTLQKLVALAFFMPVVFGMGGNIGSQSSTITVRGIATGDLSRQKIIVRLRKELAVGMLLGLTFGVFLGGAAFALYSHTALSIVVGMSIFLTMVCASSLGSMLPVLFKHLGFDPAVASGPFVTTTTDILSVAIYFSIASALI